MKGSGNLDIIQFDEIESTSAAAKEMVRAGKTAPFCLVAGRQTGGVGRYGRKFWSPVGGVYMTLVLCDTDFKYKFGTGYIAVCLVNVIKRLMADKKQTSDVEIKWVNDINIDCKKVAGILVEKVGRCFVIGIGVNLKCKEQVPDDLKDRIGFLNVGISKKDLIDKIIKEITTLKIDDEEIRRQYLLCCKDVDINLDGSRNMPDGRVLVSDC